MYAGVAEFDLKHTGAAVQVGWVPYFKWNVFEYRGRVGPEGGEVNAEMNAHYASYLVIATSPSPLETATPMVAVGIAATLAASRSALGRSIEISWESCVEELRRKGVFSLGLLSARGGRNTPS